MKRLPLALAALALTACSQTDRISTQEITREFSVADLAFVVQSDGYDARVSWADTASSAVPVTFVLLAAEATTNCTALPDTLDVRDSIATVGLDCSRSVKVSL